MERQIISSRQNPTVKEICALADKKRRMESGLFRFDGIKLLREALGAGLNIKYIVCRSPMGEKLQTMLKNAILQSEICENTIIEVSDGVFEKISEERAPEGVITVAGFAKGLHSRYDGVSALPKGKIIIAESLRDPGNLGTVIRSAYALGIDVLVLTDDCADIYNPRTLRAAMGAVFKLQTLTVKADELPEFVRLLREDGRRVYATALCERSVSINSIKLAKNDCFIIGNEGHGLSNNVINSCDASVIIPMREDAESLNAAAAAVVCIWETVRAN